MAFDNITERPPYLLHLPTNRLNIVRSNRLPTIENSSILDILFGNVSALLSLSSSSEADDDKSEEAVDKDPVDDDEQEDVRNRVRLICRSGTYSCLICVWEQVWIVAVIEDVECIALGGVLGSDGCKIAAEVLLASPSLFLFWSELSCS